MMTRHLGLPLAIALTFASTARAEGIETTLHTFTDHGDGFAPFSGLVADKKGNLYGTTHLGGPGTCGAGCGNVFKLAKRKNDRWKWSVLHTFAGSLSDGGNPTASLIIDAQGNLFGTTSTGGNAGCGVFFEMSPAQSGAWSEKVLYSFNSEETNDDGCNPYGSLASDAAGNLYGTTVKGGGGGVGGTFCFNGCGSVFQLTPNKDGSWGERVIHAFPGAKGNLDGQNPYSSVAFDGKGNLWGTTQAGGTGGTICNPVGSPPGCGTLFRLTPGKNGKWKESFLYSFQDASTGWYPYAGPVIDAADNVYGPLVNGGPGSGAVFKLAPQRDGGFVESLIYTFAPCDDQKGCLDGVFPFGGLSFDAHGNLFGTTLLGGGAGFLCNPGGPRPTGCGTVFRLTPKGDGSWREKVLFAFVGDKDGMEPSPDTVSVGSAGALFVTAAAGGDTADCADGCGTVIEIRP